LLSQDENAPQLAIVGADSDRDNFHGHLEVCQADSKSELSPGFSLVAPTVEDSRHARLILKKYNLLLRNLIIELRVYVPPYARLSVT
jgi:hypothetical protein